MPSTQRPASAWRRAPKAGSVEGMEGQLTATILADDVDAPAVREVLPLLQRKVGRIVYNGYPTGVEAARAMVHGDPFPGYGNDSVQNGPFGLTRLRRPV